AAAYPGAPYLTAMSALRTGTGLIRLAATHAVHQIVAPKLTEGTFTPLPETRDGWLARGALPLIKDQLADGFECLLIGPGLGQHPKARSVVEALLLGRQPLPARVVIDADGLNTLSQAPDWHARLPRNCVLTPHPAEFGRLAGLSTADVL